MAYAFKSSVLLYIVRVSFPLFLSIEQTIPPGEDDAKALKWHGARRKGGGRVYRQTSCSLRRRVIGVSVYTTFRVPRSRLCFPLPSVLLFLPSNSV